MNVIDTAECYGNSEELLGKALAKRRDEFLLFTKCGHPNGYASEDWSKKGLLASIERSLRRLRTDRVDLVQLHSCSLELLKKGEVIEALEEAQRRGLTRFVGYSGDSDAAIHAVESGRFSVLQISVSVADQESIDRVLPLCKKREIGVIAKRPIANAAWKTGKRPENAYHQPYFDRLAKLDYDFLRPGSKDAFATALRFTLGTPGVGTAIVGTTKSGRFAENAKMAALGALPRATEDAIRARWTKTAPASWRGET